MERKIEPSLFSQDRLGIIGSNALVAVVGVGLDPNGNNSGRLGFEGFFKVFMKISRFKDPLTGLPFSRFQDKDLAVFFAGMVE